MPRMADSENKTEEGKAAPVGRPSKYDPSFCDVLREKMGEGYSKTAVAGIIGVNHDTLVEWAKVHPEFSVAVKDGQAKRTAKLEEDLLLAKDGPSVTSRIFALKNASPHEWRDRQSHEITGQGGGPILTIDPTKCSTETLREIMAAANEASQPDEE